MYARSSLTCTKNRGLLQMNCKQSNLISVASEEPKKFNYMKRAVMQGKFIDQETGSSVDAQTKMISKIMY
jgi:hypothetical protein